MTKILRISQLAVPLDATSRDITLLAAEKLAIPTSCIENLNICKRSIDARNRNNVHFIYTLDVHLAPENMPESLPEGVSVPSKMNYILPAGLSATKKRSLEGRRPVIIGTGPCGLFCGLALARMGYAPILLERGKAVEDRIADVDALSQQGVLQPESNIQFGEGGAGTFSDGKLTTQIKDKSGRTRFVLEELVAAGAPEEILWQQKPHVGTDVLVDVVAALRRELIRLGAEVLFQHKVVMIHTKNGCCIAVECENGSIFETDTIIAAVGHSARDTFDMLFNLDVRMEQKPFSIGCRIEHLQSMINSSRYGRFANHPALGAAEYKLVHHARHSELKGRSAYTFCMCPGGEVVPSASEPGGVVTNGMSRMARDGENANAALLVNIETSDLPGPHPLAGVAFQRKWEQAAFVLAGSDYKAPAQLVADFLKGQKSRTLGNVNPSYKPGVTLTDLSSVLPHHVVQTMREAITGLDRKLRGFASPDAVLTGVETRSSSPVRMTRTNDCQSESLKGFYPAGEGAGYAGGIMSAAVDGLRVAEAVAEKLLRTL